MKNKILAIGFPLLCLLITGCENKPGNPNAETKNKSDMENKLSIFGGKYAAAWCSQKPDSVAAYFADSGSLTVNNGKPAVGRSEISKVAAGFMNAFPDMIVAMDSLIQTSNGTEFHWTLTGTNSGPGGTGNKVKISGFELWQLDNAGLIKESKGSYNAEEYDRQIKYGIDNSH